MTIFSYEPLMESHPTRKLGLFFLESILYPDEEKNLHVFEPRYKEMVANCLADDIPFVIMRGSERHIREIGCVASIVQILAQYEDGRVDIAVKGLYRVQILRIDRRKLYHQGVVEEYQDTHETTSVPKREQLIAQHIKLLEIAGRTVDPQFYNSNTPVSWMIGRNCGLTLDQRQQLLEMQSEDERIEFLINYLQEFIPVVVEKWEIRMKIMSNGHFKDFPPPSQLT